MDLEYVSMIVSTIMGGIVSLMVGILLNRMKVQNDKQEEYRKHKEEKEKEREQREENQSKLLLGVGYTQIALYCDKYIAKGSITPDEYNELDKYLFEPYTKMGGDGAAKRYMDEINKIKLS